jgi:hypothetical protein
MRARLRRPSVRVCAAGKNRRSIKIPLQHPFSPFLAPLTTGIQSTSSRSHTTAASWLLAVRARVKACTHWRHPPLVTSFRAKKIVGFKISFHFAADDWSIMLWDVAAGRRLKTFNGHWYVQGG